MKVFNCQFKMNGDGSKSLTQINCSLTIDDLSVIECGISTMKKTNNEVFESVKNSIIETIVELKK